jgi:hypothetical protein
MVPPPSGHLAMPPAPRCGTDTRRLRTWCYDPGDKHLSGCSTCEQRCGEHVGWDEVRSVHLLRRLVVVRKLKPASAARTSQASFRGGGGGGSIGGNSRIAEIISNGTKCLGAERASSSSIAKRGGRSLFNDASVRQRGVVRQAKIGGGGRSEEVRDPSWMSQSPIYVFLRRQYHGSRTCLAIRQPSGSGLW